MRFVFACLSSPLRSQAQIFSPEGEKVTATFPAQHGLAGMTPAPAPASLNQLVAF